jgi:hypothetical protein
VNWDGEYLTVADEDANIIYRFTITGAHAKLEGSTPLTGEYAGISQLWFAKGKVVGGEWRSSGWVSYWNYPAGGNPTRTIAGFKSVSGLAISPAIKR